MEYSEAPAPKPVWNVEKLTALMNERMNIKTNGWRASQGSTREAEPVGDRY